MKKKILTLAIIAMFLIGCTTSNTSNRTKEVEKGKFKVTSTGLFTTKEMKRLEPHLNLSSGGFEIEYNGDKTIVEASLELWEDGEFKQVYTNLTNNYAERDKEEPIFIGVSIENPSLSDDGAVASHINTTLTIDGAVYHGEIENYNYNNFLGRYIENLDVETVVDENESIAVWGLIGDKTEEGVVSFNGGNSIEDTVKNNDYGLILRIALK